ncbi:hypothetical protein D5R81_02215 [Parashewanella spongiae]|uniref:Uncharacterized protein n=1 Tax=Parashewanella spongiae TaxID=342950 RepID=A0A3A6UMT8_9GAMM|nr:hypothetical protein [Parashewanella spongiae]MCL1079641.1 hypothetical protein [Parashewanella spongiae]RJY19080.1 hypothetical protein D5R81_02215 [Parashewanella spongiae]
MATATNSTTAATFQIKVDKDMSITNLNGACKADISHGSILDIDIISQKGKCQRRQFLVSSATLTKNKCLFFRFTAVGKDTSSMSKKEQINEANSVKQLTKIANQFTKACNKPDTGLFTVYGELSANKDKILLKSTEKAIDVVVGENFTIAHKETNASLPAFFTFSKRRVEIVKLETDKELDGYVLCNDKATQTRVSLGHIKNLKTKQPCETAIIDTESDAKLAAIVTKVLIGEEDQFGENYTPVTSIPTVMHDDIESIAQLKENNEHLINKRVQSEIEAEKARLAAEVEAEKQKVREKEAETAKLKAELEAQKSQLSQHTHTQSNGSTPPPPPFVGVGAPPPPPPPLPSIKAPSEDPLADLKKRRKNNVGGNSLDKQNENKPTLTTEEQIAQEIMKGVTLKKVVRSSPEAGITTKEPAPFGQGTLKRRGKRADKTETNSATGPQMFEKRGSISSTGSSASSEDRVDTNNGVIKPFENEIPVAPGKTEPAAKANSNRKKKAPVAAPEKKAKK